MKGINKKTFPCLVTHMAAQQKKWEQTAQRNPL
jgi:hypothetical protein